MWQALYIVNAQIASEHLGETWEANQLYAIGQGYDPENPPFPGVGVKNIGESEPNQSTHRWDPDVLDFVAKPVDEVDDRDAIQKVFDDPEFQQDRVPASVRKNLRRLMTKHIPEAARRRPRR